jgi:hypothetical protein
VARRERVLDVPGIGSLLVHRRSRAEPKPVDRARLLRSMVFTKSIGAAGDFKQVKAKLGFNGALYFIDLGAEHDCVELWDHLTWAE